VRWPNLASPTALVLGAHGASVPLAASLRARNHCRAPPQQLRQHDGQWIRQRAAVRRRRTSPVREVNGVNLRGGLQATPKPCPDNHTFDMA